MKKIVTIITTLVLSISMMISLTACNKGDDGVIENTNSKAIGTHYIINNALVDKSANGGLIVIDSKTAIAYSVYLASENKYGESDELVKLAKFSIMQPTNVNWVTVFDRDVDFGGAKLSECNIIDLFNDYVRVFAVNMSDYNYYYKDVNKKTLEVGELKQVKYKSAYKSPAVTFSKENINAHIKELGGQEFGHLQFGSAVVVVDRTYYVTFCGGNNMQNFIFMESGDGETWSFKSLVKHAINYEAPIAFHNDTFYVTIRNGNTKPTGEKQQNLMYSEDMGKTWKLSNLALESSDTRPFLFNYQGELYLAYSSPLAIDYSTVRPWRCNVHVGKIVTKNGEQTFEEVIYKQSKFGIVYYSLIDWYGYMIMIYSSGELYPETGRMGDYTQGKDCLMYTILKTEEPKDLKLK